MQSRLEALQTITYASPESLGDRIFLIMPFWDGQQWQHWAPSPDGSLIALKIVDVASSHYVAKSAAAPNDIWVPFIDLFWQRMTWPEAYPIISALCDDFQNLGTSVAKIRHFYDCRDGIKGNSLSSFVATELEYLVITARTIFDLLQEAVSKIWNERIRLVDTQLDAIKKQRRVPPTFAKMVLRDKLLVVSPDAMCEKYAITPTLAAAYARHAPFFVALRNSRDKIIHGGRSDLSSVFVTERGFCVDPKSSAFSAYDCWDVDHMYNSNIASILPWLAHLVFRTIEACNDISSAFASELQLPEEIAPGYRVFIRDQTGVAFLDLQRAHKGDLIWWGDEPNAE